MHDYAQRYQSRGRVVVRRPGWRAMERDKGNSLLFWKTLAIVVLLAAAMGVAASYWLGHCIQQGLMEIAQARELQDNTAEQRVALLDEQLRLLQSQRLEAYAAVQVGLYSPNKQQRVGFH